MPYSSNRTPFDYEPVMRSPRAKDLWDSEAVETHAAGAENFDSQAIESQALEFSSHASPSFNNQFDKQSLDSQSTDTENRRAPVDVQGNEEQEFVHSPSASNRRAAKRETWIERRGHALSFAGLLLFTFVLYFRPYELFPALAGLSSMAFWIALFTLAVFLPTQLSIEGNLTARPREVNLVLLLCLAAFLSIPLAMNRGESLDAFRDFMRPVLMFIVLVNVVRSEKRLRLLLYLTLAVGCVLGLGAISDYRQGNFTVEGYRVAGRIGNLFGNPNDMALHLVTVTPIAVALLLSSRRLIAKMLYAACVVVLVLGNMVTFSRGAFLGLLGVFAVMAWKLGRRNRMFFGAATLVVLVGFFALAPGTYTDRLGSILDKSRDQVGSAGARQALLVRSLEVAAQHPLFGVGMGNFHIVSVHEQVSHNAYTQIAAEMGLAALVFYVLFMVAPLRRLRLIERETFEKRRERRDPSSRFYYLSIGLQASLVGYMVSSFFGSVAYQFYIYYLVGYAICLRRIYAQTDAAKVKAEVKHTQDFGAAEVGQRALLSSAGN